MWGCKLHFSRKPRSFSTNIPSPGMTQRHHPVSSTHTPKHFQLNSSFLQIISSRDTEGDGLVLVNTGLPTGCSHKTPLLLHLMLIIIFFPLSVPSFVIMPTLPLYSSAAKCQNKEEGGGGWGGRGGGGSTWRKGN